MADLFDNPMGLMGFEFVEFASPEPKVLEPLFEQLGFTYVGPVDGHDLDTLLPLLREQVKLPASAFRFLAYHGANDEHHLARWLQAVDIVLAIHPAAAAQIVQTARHTAQLYSLQFELI